MRDGAMTVPRPSSSEVAAVTPSYAGHLRTSVWRRAACNGLARIAEHAGTRILHKDRVLSRLGQAQRRGVAAAAGSARCRVSAAPHHRARAVPLPWRHDESPRRAGLNEIYPEGTVEINPAGRPRAGHPGWRDGASQLAPWPGRGQGRSGGRPGQGVVFMTFHFKEAAANLLTIAALDPVAKIPELKACAVKLERAA